MARGSLHSSQHVADAVVIAIPTPLSYVRLPLTPNPTRVHILMRWPGSSATNASDERRR